MMELEKKFQGKDIVFISISIDTKEHWKKSRGIYSSPSAIQLYTNGEGANHVVIKYAGIRSYLALFILDKQGRFLANTLDPRYETGKADLIKLIESQLAQKAN